MFLVILLNKDLNKYHLNLKEHNIKPLLSSHAYINSEKFCISEKWIYLVFCHLLYLQQQNYFEA
jgi:hypothetical protein